jgi:hypothetical protein
MASAETEKGRDIERYSRNLESETFLFIPVLERSELQLLLHNPVSRFPAADILVLVTAAHVDKTPLFERFECHGRGIMVAGKKITGLVRQALPALEPERFSTKFQRTTVDKEHSPVNPLHRHSVEYGEEGGIPQLLVTVRARSIAPAHQETMEIGMVMVTKDRYEPVFPGQAMNLHKSFLGPVTAVEKIAEINKDINRAKFFTEERGLNAC